MEELKVPDDEYAARFKDSKLEERHLVAIQQALPMEDRKVLDLGCANGKTLKHIERYKPEATGIDKVKPLIDNAKRNTKFPY
jgi:2-polyprenyl-3-methyl-5-hydroxy-6-metoxy-1,4-benzoquinol methylase